MEKLEKMQNIEKTTITEEMVFEKINPLIEQSMTNEQKREVKRLINLALPKQTKKLISINTNFWFFNIYYLTLYVGSEKRDKNRKFSKNRLFEILFMIISTIFIFSGLISIVFAIFLALYYLKSLMGIDLFSFHLIN